MAALLLMSATVGALAVVTDQVSAGHGAEANYTVIPEDRQPGMDNATYTQYAISPRHVDYLDYIAATWHPGGFTGCGPGNTEVFGIDRGNNNDGRQVDEDLRQYVEETHVGEDRFKADFYEKDDAVGSSTHLAKGDQFVGYVKNCFDNPDEAGWYQIRSSVGGWTENDTYIQRNTSSHYFAVCDCKNEQEARRKLGPPPSEQGGNNGGDANGSKGDDSGNTDDGGAGTETMTATPETRDGGTSDSGMGAENSSGDSTTATTRRGTSTASDGRTGTDAGTNRGDGGEAGSWDDHLEKTPTPGAGPGLGPLGAIIAILACAYLSMRRTL